MSELTTQPPAPEEQQKIKNEASWVELLKSEIGQGFLELYDYHPPLWFHFYRMMIGKPLHDTTFSSQQI